ncbi:MAG: DegT/DnrJ/EryC1/StrS family aminotransferase [Pirellulales bacterium]
MSNDRIYLSPPHLTGGEQRYVQEVFASNWVAPAGPHLQKFEQKVCETVGVHYAVAVNSGTAALHLALRHLGIGAGDEVFCSTLSFCASANPIVYEGARPVFIDSETSSWNMDPTLLSDELKACSRRNKLPRAVIAVDLFGQSADMDPIIEVADKYGIPVIEDAAEALGATYRDRMAGASGWASFFSFNGNKILTTSGGGILCSNNKSLIEHARFLACQARDPAPHYQHSQIGFNYRMSNVLAAVGIAQLEALEERVASRRGNFEYYRAQLDDVPGISFMPEAPFGRSNRWLTVILIDPNEFGATREDVWRRLNEQNIEARPIWKPLHLQPVFAECRARTRGVAEALFTQGLCLPSGSAATASQLRRVVDCIRDSAKSGDQSQQTDDRQAA